MNGGFTPDKSQGPKTPRDLSGVKPTFEEFNRDLKHDQGGFVKEFPRDIYMYIVPGLYRVSQKNRYP